MTPALDPGQAEAILTELAGVFFKDAARKHAATDAPARYVEARYRALVEQIPAVIFMAYLDQGIGEAYVSPQIERALGFSQSEWLEDPVRWYQQIHPDDKNRWSVEAAQMFLSGQPLRSAYRVIARDGHVVWFHCEATMVRTSDGRPWFIQGVAFDITELKLTEAALAEERNILSAILNTVAALVVVLDPEGRIVRFNRACEQATGHTFAQIEGRCFCDLFFAPEESERFQSTFVQLLQGGSVKDYESRLLTHDGGHRLISWSTTVLPRDPFQVRFVIATGIDITERKRLEGAILQVSNSEQRRIGQDLHDGLGQHLTGIAFMSKALEQKLADRALPEACDASKIVELVNQGIRKTRDLAHGLLPVFSDSLGLTIALQRWAAEVEDLFCVSCKFEGDEPVLINNDVVTNHLYRIAQEAVHNAIKHGKAGRITIGLSEMDGLGILNIQDDGSGIQKLDANHAGMGLSIMRYRAGMIGGTLEIAALPERGTLVRCAFPK